MRIFPFILITIGVFGLLRHFGYIDPAALRLLWPVVLIAIGLAMLARGPRWRADVRERMQDRWERRMHRHFGPGWANLSEEERECFRAGMRQWRGHGPGADIGNATGSTAAGTGSPSTSSTQPPASGEPR